MYNITFVIGLPASGKSYYCRELSEMTGGVVFDDFSLHKDGYINMFKEHRYSNLIINDPYLCFVDEVRIKSKIVELLEIEELDCEFKFIYFTNEPEQCLINARSRSDKIVTNFIKECSRVYEPEGKMNIVSVYKSK